MEESEEKCSKSEAKVSCITLSWRRAGGKGKPAGEFPPAVDVAHVA